MVTFRIEYVVYMPPKINEGILYVSREYEVAVHHCACGCGAKIVTPLSPTDWRLSESHGKPSLWPSIGNWQLPCRSHYVIKNGKVIWAKAWTDEEIKLGRTREIETTNAYYKRKYSWSRFFTRILNALQQPKKNESK